MTCAVATDRLAFSDLIELDDRLMGLEELAHRVAAVENRKWKYRCGARPWYNDVKPQLVHLVGNQRRPAHPVLSTSDAYDVAYDHLYALMPDCRECSCL